MICAALPLLVPMLGGCGDTVRDPNVLCFIQDNNDGTQLITCNNGVDLVVADGRVGQPGTGCSAQDNGDGTVDMVCDDGSHFTVFDGVDGSSCRVTQNIRDEVVILCDDGSTGSVAQGTSCTAIPDAETGSVTISCEDGTSATVVSGQDGGSCTVSRDDKSGVVTVSCGGDQATVQDGPQGSSCRVVEGGEGTGDGTGASDPLDVSIVCDDGSTEVVVEGTSRIGTLTGVAQLLNQTDHSGILVQVVGIDPSTVDASYTLSTTTAADGSYTLPRVPIGVRALQFSHDGYSMATRDDLAVLPGSPVVVDPVLLRPDELVVGGNRAEIMDVCDDQHTLVLLLNTQADRTAPPDLAGVARVGTLAVWHQGDASPTPIAQNVSDVIPSLFGYRSCPAQGGSVFYVHDLDFASFTAGAAIWSQATGTSREFGWETFYDVQFASEKERYATLELIDDTPVLRLYDADTDTFAVIDSDFDESGDYRIAEDGGSVLWSQDDGLRLYRVSDGATFFLSSYPDAFSGAVYGDHGRRLAFQHDVDGQRTMAVMDVGSGSVYDAAPTTVSSQQPLFSPDGNWLAFRAGDDEVLVLFNPDLDFVGPVPTADDVVQFDQGSTRVAFLLNEDNGASGDLYVYTLGSEWDPVHVTANVPSDPSAFGFSPDGSWMFIKDDSDETLLYSVEENLLSSPAPADLDVLFAPDSSSLTFDVEGDRILLTLGSLATIEGFDLGNFGGNESVVYAPDGSELAVQSPGDLSVFDASDGSSLFEQSGDFEVPIYTGTTMVLPENTILFPNGSSQEVNGFALWTRTVGSDQAMPLDDGLIAEPIVNGHAVAWQTAHLTYPEYLADGVRFAVLP